MTDKQHKAYFVCNLDVWTKNHEKEVFMLVPTIHIPQAEILKDHF